VAAHGYKLERRKRQFKNAGYLELTLFAVAFAMVFRLEVVGIASVALILQLSAFACDGVVVPVIQGSSSTGWSIAFIRRLEIGGNWEAQAEAILEIIKNILGCMQTPVMGSKN